MTYSKIINEIVEVAGDGVRGVAEAEMRTREARKAEVRIRSRAETRENKAEKSAEQ